MPTDYIGPYSPEYYDEMEQANYQESYRPWWYDLGIEAIRRGSETAQVIGSGWPSIPQIPQPTPQPIPSPTTPLAPGVTPQPQGGSLQLSNTTLMLIVGGVLLFMLGKRGR